MVDIEDVLQQFNAGDNGSEPKAPVENSESMAAEGKEPSEGLTTNSSADNGEGEETNAQQEVVASDGRDGVPTEGATERRPKAFKRELTRQDKAEFSAAKWKRKYKEMKGQRDSIKAEFDNYKDLNPRAIRNPEDRANFVMWKASTQQRLKDMDEDLNAMRHEHDEDVYESKIARCYNDKTEQDFRQLDEYYGDTFRNLCAQKDPGNVIMDYLRSSDYEPAMRHVIYKNGKLQADLFRDFGNPMITAVERTNTLKRLESQIKDFYENQQKPATANKTATKRTVPQHLPPQRNAKGQFSSIRIAPQPNNKKPQVTGSITRGRESGGQPDVSSLANNMYKTLFKMGV